VETLAEERRRLISDLPIDRAELARRADCSTGTLSDWINAKRPVKKHLNDAIMREIEKASGGSGIEVKDSESVTSPLELKEQQAEYGSQTNWQRRAEKAESENAKLKQALRAFIDESPPPKPK
jgi:hypothetical protein